MEQQLADSMYRFSSTGLMCAWICPTGNATRLRQLPKGKSSETLPATLADIVFFGHGWTLISNSKRVMKLCQDCFCKSLWTLRRKFGNDFCWFFRPFDPLVKEHSLLPWEKFIAKNTRSFPEARKVLPLLCQLENICPHKTENTKRKIDTADIIADTSSQEYCFAINERRNEDIVSVLLPVIHSLPSG